MSGFSALYSFSLAVLLAIVPATSGAFQILSGKWRVQAEIQNPLTQQPQLRESTACIDQSSFDPTMLMLLDGDCSITDKQDRGNAIRWKFSCGGHGQGMPASTGTASLVSHGRTASGVVQLAMVFNGQTLSLNSTLRGEHLSSRCD